MLRKYILTSAILAATAIPNAFGIAFLFDYTYDTNNFFTAERRSVVNLAAENFSGLEIDRTAIIPTGGNTWGWTVGNPSNQAEDLTITNPSIGAGEIRVYLGAQALGSLGLGGNIGLSASGSQAWIDLLTSTNTNDAYKPFGGTISLNLNSTWYSGTDPNVTSGAYDMYSVVAHELGHVLGFGLYNYVDAWTTDTNDTNHTFTGPAATLAYGSALPLTTDNAHIATGTTFAGQTMIMVPAITAGTRRYWTAPELGALADIGYVSIPEPSAVALIFCAGAILAFRHKTRDGAKSRTRA